MSKLASSQHITPFLWFNGQAEEAMKLYTTIFPDSEIISLKKWGKGSSFPENWVMMGTIVINGLKVHLFDAGPDFSFNESVSFFVSCNTQNEIDNYWNRLTADGGQESQCGWLKDKFGFSWQIVPASLGERLANGDPEKAGNMFKAVLKMKKLIIAELDTAYNG